MSEYQIDISPNEIVEPSIVKDVNQAYELLIVGCKEGLNKNQKPYVMFTFEIIDVVGAKNFSNYYGIPTGDMTSKRKNELAYNLQQLCSAVNIPFQNPFNPELLLGRSFKALLGVTKEDPTYGVQNKLVKIMGGSSRAAVKIDPSIAGDDIPF